MTTAALAAPIAAPEAAQFEIPAVREIPSESKFDFDDHGAMDVLLAGVPARLYSLDGRLLPGSKRAVINEIRISDQLDTSVRSRQLLTLIGKGCITKNVETLDIICRTPDALIIRSMVFGKAAMKIFRLSVDADDRITPVPDTYSKALQWLATTSSRTACTRVILGRSKLAPKPVAKN